MKRFKKNEQPVESPIRSTGVLRDAEFEALSDRIADGLVANLNKQVLLDHAEDQRRLAKLNKK